MTEEELKITGVTVGMVLVSSSSVQAFSALLELIKRDAEKAVFVELPEDPTFIKIRHLRAMICRAEKTLIEFDAELAK